VLPQYGIEAGRVRLEWVSASEGERFGHVVDEFTGEIRKLGPLKIKESLFESMKTDVAHEGDERQASTGEAR
jgi:F420-non-reducing hydrogenase iron-sulfur subunit